MSKLVIYILGQNFEMEQFMVEGVSASNYPFMWHRTRSRYEYAPVDSEAAGDIFQSQNPNSLFFFSAEMVDEDGAPAAASKPGIPPPALERKYYGDLDADELQANCREVGIPLPAFAIEAPADEARPVLLALLDAYWLGAGYKAVKGAPKQQIVDLLNLSTDEEKAVCAYVLKRAAAIQPPAAAPEPAPVPAVDSVDIPDDSPAPSPETLTPPPRKVRAPRPARTKAFAVG